MLLMGPIILVPFVALALTCLALPFVRFLIGQGVFQQRREPPELVDPPTEPVIPRASPPPPTPRAKPSMPAKPILPLDIIRRASNTKPPEPNRPKKSTISSDSQ